jgi:hypothetical protein
MKIREKKLYHYKVNDKVLLKGNKATKYGTNSYEGPYIVTKVNNPNSTVN